MLPPHKAPTPHHKIFSPTGVEHSPHLSGTVGLLLMKPDVTINEVSMLSLGWLHETVNFPTSQSQSNTITVSGRNSPIRFTEALGRVAYQPLSFDMTFSLLGDRADYDRLVSAVVNQFAGQLCRVTLTEDPTLYALGTLEADPTYDPLTGKGTLVLSCTDGDAFLYYVEETVESISGSGTVTLRNDFMPVVPVILDCREGDVYQYQFLINPQDHPECFEKAA